MDRHAEASAHRDRVAAILLGAAFLGERLEPQHILGMAAIAAGLALIDGRLFRLRKPAA